MMGGDFFGKIKKVQTLKYAIGNLTVVSIPFVLGLFHFKYRCILYMIV